MQLLPLIVLFILTIIILIGIFILLSFIYFRIKHKRNLLTEQLSLNDTVDDPYLEMVPLDSSPTDRHVKPPSSYPRPPQQKSLNLSRMRASKNTSLSLSIPTINPNKTLQTTALLQDMPQSQQKFSYISKLVNYTPEGIQLYTYEVTTITTCRVYRNLGWEYDFRIYPIVDHMVCKKEQEGFGDLLDVFKLEVGEYKTVKFVMDVIVKNCQEDRLYYVYDLTKVERVEIITHEEFEELRRKEEEKEKGKGGV